jgi:hypothetical protein
MLAAISSPVSAIKASPSAPDAAPGIIIVPNIGPRDRMAIVDPNSASPRSCPATSWYEAARRGGKLKRQRLNELPAASAYKAVFRHIDKCLAPIIVRYGVGER